MKSLGIMLPALLLSAISGIQAMEHVNSLYRWCMGCSEKFIPTLENLTIITIKPSTQSITEEMLDATTLALMIYHGKAPEQCFIEIQDEIYTVHRGISIGSENSLVFIYSRGLAHPIHPSIYPYSARHGACLFAARSKIKGGIINNAPVITFDYPDERHSFGQEIDIACLQLVYHSIITLNPHARIVIVGDCRGAKVALELATQKPANLAALILETPFFEQKHVVQAISQNLGLIGKIPGISTIIDGAMRFYFADFDPSQDDLMNHIHHIDKNLPIFIGHRVGDIFIPDKPLNEFENIMAGIGNTHIHVHRAADNYAFHSRIFLETSTKKAIHLFLKKHNLPYEPVIANSQP